MRWIPAFGLAFLFATTSYGSTIHCVANVTITRFTLSLDTATREMSVVTSDGFRYEGNATHYFSPRSGDDYYHLVTGFSSALDVDVESGGQGRIALCLSSSECYACRAR